MATVLLEVTALHAADAEAADAGGADRLQLVAQPEAGGTSPEPSIVSSVVRATELPVRVMLRLSPAYTATGGELSRLVGLGGEYLARGAEGLALGFLTRDLEVDIELTAALLGALPDVSWTFHGVDATLDPRRSWRRLLHLPGLDAVQTAGSAIDADHGQDELVRLARHDERTAQRILVAGGLRPEHVPWLVSAGIRQFRADTQVRPGGTWAKANVDPGHVRAWRLLLDDTVERAAAAV